MIGRVTFADGAERLVEVPRPRSDREVLTITELVDVIAIDRGVAGYTVATWSPIGNLETILLVRTLPVQGPNSDNEGVATLTTTTEGC